MTHDITPGTYRNTNTGIEFTLELDDETDEAIMHCGHGESAFEIRKDQGNFWFNTLDATGPTYELIEAADKPQTTEEQPETTAEPDRETERTGEPAVTSEP